jgi:hypothetical protein
LQLPLFYLSLSLSVSWEEKKEEYDDGHSHVDSDDEFNYDDEK